MRRCARGWGRRWRWRLRRSDRTICAISTSWSSPAGRWSRIAAPPVTAQGLSLPLLRRQNAARLRRIATRIGACPALKARRDILTFIRGGRTDLRRTLYMPALAAMRHNPDLTRFADRLRDRGKPPKVVITAVMRKLFITANALIREGRAWMPKTA